jgi:hypothetical protein
MLVEVFGVEVRFQVESSDFVVFLDNLYESGKVQLCVECEIVDVGDEDGDLFLEFLELFVITSFTESIIVVPRSLVF